MKKRGKMDLAIRRSASLSAENEHLEHPERPRHGCHHSFPTLGMSHGSSPLLSPFPSPNCKFSPLVTAPYTPKYSGCHSSGPSSHLQPASFKCLIFQTDPVFGRVVTISLF